MTITEYLAARDLTLTAFADALGEKVQTVHGWASGRRKPDVLAVAKIEAVTDGAVRAADFVPVESL